MAGGRESGKVSKAEFAASLQYGLATYLRGVGPLDSLQHPGQVLEEETIKSFMEKVVGSLVGGICERPAQIIHN